MIKIPEKKYSGLAKIYLEHTEDYVKEAISFYIHCSSLVMKQISDSDFKNNIHSYSYRSSFYSLIKVISDKFYGPTSRVKIKSPSIPEVKTILEVFSKNLIQSAFISSAKAYRDMLEDMLNPLKPVYFKNILTYTPELLVSLYDHIYNNYFWIQDAKGTSVFRKDGVNKGLFYDILSSIFNYDKLSKGVFKRKNSKAKWGAYHLCEALNINVCPYCNRMYTFTVVKQKTGEALTRPELDHYIPQSKFPLFGISFYNLIPSCKVCNSSFKGDKHLDIGNYLHPYMNGVHSSYKFDYEPLDIGAFDGDKRQVIVMMNKNGAADIRTDNTLRLFGIEEIYRKHNDVVSDLILKRKRYSNSKIAEIAALFSTGDGSSVTVEEIFNSLFDVPVETEIIDHSLGKLRSDIIHKLRTLP